MIDTNFDENGQFYHEYYTPYLMNQPQKEGSSLVYKYQGNIVVKREHVEKILLDKKANQKFDDLLKMLKNKSLINYEA